MSGAGGADLLILLLDAPLLSESLPAATAQREPQACLLEQILYFVAAYLMVNDRNQLAVYLLQRHSCDLLYASVGQGSADGAGAQASNPTREIRDALLEALKRGATAPEGGESRGPGDSHNPPAALHGLTLSAGLSRALCLVNRLRGGSVTMGGGGAATTTGPKPRILCVVGAPDAPAQYIPSMNAIFSAQRAEVCIDTLRLGASHSGYLQQAAHLTGGLYLQAAHGNGGVEGGPAVAGLGPGRRSLPAAAGALQYLLSCMTMDASTRAALRVHQPLGVDFRASCFCHKTPVEVGYVCSVCLSIYCAPCTECVTCGSQFNPPAHQPG